jgi:hypothetical protein
MQLRYCKAHVVDAEVNNMDKGERKSSGVDNIPAVDATGGWRYHWVQGIAHIALMIRHYHMAPAVRKSIEQKV